MLSLYSPRRMARIAIVCVVVLSLAACGGGGGGSGDNGNNGGGDRGGFTLGAATATFRVLRNDPPPPQVRIPISVTGSAVAVMGAAFVGQTPPSWLGVTIEGTGRNLTLVLNALDTSLTADHYSSTLTVGSADQDGNILTTRQVQITYDVLIGMVVTAAQRDYSFVFGSSDSTAQVSVSIDAPGKSWTITSNQPWLAVPAGTQQGTANLTLALDSAAITPAPGAVVAQLVVQNTTESIDRRVVTINAAVAPPLPIVVANPVVLGGTTGLGAMSQQLDVSLDTGTNAYPWTLTLDTAQSPGWVVGTGSTGDISNVQHGAVTLGVGSSIGAAGNYSATAHFDVTVAGQTFRTSVPVTLKWHGQRLVPARAGVAFSRTPSGLQPATRRLKISGSRGVNGIPWTASSDQNWLTATASGVTGDELELEADPSGLAADQIHLAQVTLSSASAGIERNEVIRVGLWVGSTNPDNVDTIVSEPPFALAVNPVEPYAYSHHGGAIHVYNVYSGAEIATFTGSEFDNLDVNVAYPASMDVSSDGSTLYFANGLTSRVIAMNAATGAVTATYQLTPRFNLPLDAPVQYMRANGYPVLWTPFGELSTEIIDLEAGAPVRLTTDGFDAFREFPSTRGFAQDGSRIFSLDGLTTSTTIDVSTVAFAVLGGRALEVNPASGFGVVSNGSIRQLCVGAAGTRVYVQSSSGLHEAAIDSEPAHYLRDVPLPHSDGSVQAVDCNWNGRVYVGLASISVPHDNAFALDAQGNDLGSFLSGPALSGIIVRQMGLSGDARRVISTHVIPADPQPQFAVSFYNVPP